MQNFFYDHSETKLEIRNRKAIRNSKHMEICTLLNNLCVKEVLKKHVELNEKL